MDRLLVSKIKLHNASILFPLLRSSASSGAPFSPPFPTLSFHRHPLFSLRQFPEYM